MSGFCKKGSYLWFMLFSIVLTSQYVVKYNSEERMDLKQKQNDMAYGQMLSSIEAGELDYLTNLKYRIQKRGMQKREARGGKVKKLSIKQNQITTEKAPTRFTKCSTDEPITIDPHYYPSSSEEGHRHNTNQKIHTYPGKVVTDKHTKGTTKPSYLAPKKPKDLHHYYDDQ